MKKILSNLHTHSQFSDGKNTAEEIVIAAIEKGLTSIGFSEHAYNSYDIDCRISAENIPFYHSEIARLREKYSDKISVYKGIENDYYEPMNQKDFDYTIGSVHYLKDASGNYHTIDYLPELFENAVKYVGNGSVKTVVECYFELVVDTAINQKPDVLGHIDLITKLNNNNKYFDVKSKWYINLIEKTVSEIAKTNCIVEINTGNVYRGYSATPYPSIDFLNLILSHKIPITISSDSHCVDSLNFLFDETANMLINMGFSSTKQLISGVFLDIPFE